MFKLLLIKLKLKIKTIMFEEIIDGIMLQYHQKYVENKDKIDAEDDEFSKSKTRRQMNELVSAIVILYQNKNKGYN